MSFDALTLSAVRDELEPALTGARVQKVVFPDELSLAVESYHQAEATLEEAHATAVRGQMRLHQADSHLQYAKLHLARRQTELARKSFTEARQRVQSMGYHRRDSDLQNLEAML